MTTQAEVDAQIDRYIALSIKQEEKRDKQVWESPAYWRHHDLAIKWRLKAQALMPKPCCPFCEARYHRDISRNVPDA